MLMPASLIPRPEIVEFGKFFFSFFTLTYYSQRIQENSNGVFFSGDSRKTQSNSQYLFLSSCSKSHGGFFAQNVRATVKFAVNQSNGFKIVGLAEYFKE
jgi:hypothetical protein